MLMDKATVLIEEEYLYFNYLCYIIKWYCITMTLDVQSRLRGTGKPAHASRCTFDVN